MVINILKKEHFTKKNGGFAYFCAIMEKKEKTQINPANPGW